MATVENIVLPKKDVEVWKTRAWTQAYRVQKTVEILKAYDFDQDNVLTEEDLCEGINNLRQKYRDTKNIQEKANILFIISVLFFTRVLLGAFRIKYEETNKKCKAVRPAHVFGLCTPMFNTNYNIKLLEKICCAYYNGPYGQQFQQWLHAQAKLSAAEFPRTTAMEHELIIQLRELVKHFLVGSQKNSTIELDYQSSL